MTGRIIRLICWILMSLWITSKAMVLSPLLGIPLIGVTVWYSITEISEIKEDKKNAKKHVRKSNTRRKKVTN